MFLKRLDVIGFKSFAERISVDFVKGVTAVASSERQRKEQHYRSHPLGARRTISPLASGRKNGRYHFCGK